MEGGGASPWRAYEKAALWPNIRPVNQFHR